MTKKRDLPAKPVAAELPRRHRHLRQREALFERRIILGVGVAIGLVVILLAAGAVNEYLLKPRRPIAVVNDQQIDTASFQRRLRYEQDNLVGQIDQYLQFGAQFASSGGGNPFQSYIQQLLGQLQQPEVFSTQVLDQMIDEKLIGQLATELGVAVSDDDLQLEIESQFGYDRNPPTPAPTPTPDPATTVTNTVTNTVPTTAPVTAEDFQTRYTDTISGLADRNSLTETEFREVIRSGLLRTKVQEAAPLEVETTEEQVKARHILINIDTTEGTDAQKAEADALLKIQEIRKRLEAGESFEEVAKAESQDTGSGANGGDLGWFGRGQMVAEFEEVAFALEPGVLSEPVKTQFGYHLIRVDEKDPARPVDEAELEQRRQTAFDDWLSAKRTAANIQRQWTASAVPSLPTDLVQALNSLAQVLNSQAQTAVTPEPVTETEAVEVTPAAAEATPTP